MTERTTYVIHGFRNRTNVDGAPVERECESIHSHSNAQVACESAVRRFFESAEQWDAVTVEIQNGFIGPEFGVYGTLMRINRSALRNLTEGDIYV